MTAVANERGIALIVTLLVVALLTITVVEFTYSVEIDQHMARNALHSLQASLLARAGINLGEALLLHDNDPRVDAFTEEWCPGPSDSSCLIDESNSQLVLPDNMRLRVQIIDESGKLNINMTRPRDRNEWCRMWQAANTKNAVPSQAQLARDALAQLLAGQAGEAVTIDALEAQWDQQFTALYGSPCAVP